MDQYNSFSNFRSTLVKRKSLNGIELVDTNGIDNNNKNIKMLKDYDSDTSSDHNIIETVENLEIEDECYKLCKCIKSFIEDEKESEKIEYSDNDIYKVVKYNNNYYQLLVKQNNILIWNEIDETYISNKFKKKIKNYYLKLPSIYLFSLNDIVKFRNKYYQLSEDVEREKLIYYWSKLPKKCKLGKTNRIVTKVLTINVKEQLNNINCNKMDIIFCESTNKYYQMYDIKNRKYEILNKNFNPNNVGPQFIPKTCKKMIMKGSDNKLYVSNKNRFGKFIWKKKVNIMDSMTAEKYYSQFKNYKDKYNIKKILLRLKKLEKKLNKNSIYFYIVPWKESYDIIDMAWNSTKKFIKDIKRKDPDLVSYIFITRYTLFFGSHETGILYFHHNITKKDKKKINIIFDKVFKNKYYWDENKNHTITIYL